MGDNIAFEMNVGSPTFAGITVAAGTVTSINGNNVTFTHLVGKWGSSNNFIRIPDGAARPKTIGDPGGVPPCSANRLGTPTWCSQAYWGGYNPSNITITHNYINKPQRWHDFAGSDGKGFFEIKLCDTCLIDGNIFEGKTGFTVTVRNQGGRAPWSAIRNLTISNNLATQFSAGLYGLFSDNEQLSMESSNIVFHNNLMYGQYDDSSVSGFLPRIFSGSHGDNVRFTHNTILQTGRIMAYGNSPEQAGNGELTNFVFRDNLVNWGTGSQSGYGCFDGALEVCTPSYVWTRNAMIGAPTGPLYEAQSLASFPSGNWNPANLSAVGFVNPAAGNYRLLSSSPYYRAASDGKDVGVDMDQLLAHLNAAIPVPTPTPTPIPSPTPTPTPIPTPTPTPGPIPTPSLTSVLVTAPTGTPLHGVSNGTTINLAELPTRSLTISIVPAIPVGSVKVQYNGEESVENVAPYSLAGDTDGEFNPANLSVGIHTLTVTPFSQPNLGGSPGAPVTISFAVVDNPDGTPPILLTDPNSDRAIALNAATFIPEPFALFTGENFSSDKRTRVNLFVTNFQSSTDGVGSETVAYAENSVLGTHSLPVEHLGRVPNFEWITQITVILPDALANAGDVWVRVVLRGLSSNQARISVREPALGATIPRTLMTPRVDSWIAPNCLLRCLTREHSRSLR